MSNAGTTAPSKPSLRREMSYLDLTMASLSGIVGSGWLFGAYYATSDAGPAAIFAWLFGAIAIGLMAFLYAELTGMLPAAGGVARYPNVSHGRVTSFIIAWCAYLGGAATPPIEAEAVMQYSSRYVPGLYANHSLTGRGFLVAIVLVIVLFLINYYGIKAFAWINTRLTLLKLTVPWLTVIVLAFFFKGRNFTIEGFAPHGLSGIMTAISTAGVIFALLGFRQAIDLAGEARRGHRDVPRAILTAIGVATLLYFGLQITFVGAVPTSLIQAHGWAGLKFTSPLANTAMILGAGWLATLLFADAIVSPGADTLVYLATAPRILYAMQRNGYMPKSFGRIHKQHRVPFVALLVNLLIGMVFLVPFPSWQHMVGFISSAVVLSYLIGPVSASVLRRTAPDAARTFRVRGIKLWAPLAYIFAGLVVYWSGWPTDGYVLLILCIGFIFFAIHAVRSRIPAEEWRAAIWMMAYVVFLTLVSFLGSFGGIKAIVYPWDVLIVVVGSLIAFYWGVASGIPTTESMQLNDRSIAVQEEGN
ncbi:APC family permease [Alicyclobacillus tolerans]|uniref:APC family permease n=1 Tax=Alicyclobacillus tolerans TaxID=90970 RepID=UPI001F22F982|nr:APC family permease [Alicyclobacillus tolerans]MCF8567463.1 APC family permease [Alicyclobacillus tolerans]